MQATTEQDAGLATLQAEGLDLAALDDGDVMEPLLWRRALPQQMPDAEASVLVQYIDPTDSARDICSAWWDGEVWRDCASGGQIEATVTYWADPKGPQ